jgi:hypothetical protein
MKQQF